MPLRGPTKIDGWCGWITRVKGICSQQALVFITFFLFSDTLRCVALHVCKNETSNDCRIHRLLLFRGVRPPYQWVYWYDTKKFYGKAPVIRELWRMLSTPSLPSLPGSLRPGVAVSDRVLSLGQIELNCILMVNWIVWNRTVLTFNCLLWKTIFILNWIF